MAALNPQGEMQFWYNGQPFAGVKKSGNDGGQMQFWYNGQPYAYIFPVAGPTNVKSFNGLVTASIKVVDGLDIASVKSVQGLT